MKKYIYFSVVIMIVCLSFLSCPNTVIQPDEGSKLDPQDDSYPEPAFFSDTYEADFDLTRFPDSESTGIAGAGIGEEELVLTGSIHIYSDRVLMGGGDVPVRINSSHELFTSGRIQQTANGGFLIQKLLIDDGIYIYAGAKNTIIQYCRIRRGSYGIKCSSESINTLIRYCTLYNDLEYRTIDGKECSYRNPNAEGKAILASNCRIESCDISGYTDGIYLTNNVEIVDCYIHDFYFYDPRWDNPGTSEDMTHSDGIQNSGGGNYLIYHNRIEAVGFNSALIIQNIYGNTHHVMIENNQLRGGNYTVYIQDRPDAKEDYTVSDIVVRNNILYHEDVRHLFAFQAELGILFSGNRHENGEILDVNNADG